MSYVNTSIKCQVLAVSVILSLALGGNVLAQEGTVVAWGINFFDQQSRVPLGLSGVVAISGGGNHCLALKSDGTVVAWGQNYHGSTSVPPGLSGVVAIAAGSLGYSLALKGDGTVVSWGTMALFGSDPTPPPPGLVGVKAISVGGGHSLALKSDGTVVAWGSNNYPETTVPPGLSGVVAISAGGYHSLALKSDGTVVAWGRGLGGGEVISVPPDLSGVVAISAGSDRNLALKSDGTVVAWGSNFYGQTTVPPGLSGVTAIDARGYNNLVILTALTAGSSSATSASGGFIGQGDTAAITLTLTNPSSLAVSATYIATLPTGLSAISCSAPFGSCTISTGARMSVDDGRNGLSRRATPSAPTASQTVTWTGTIPGNGSVTITHLVQVSVQANSGTKYCLTSLVNGGTGPSPCLTVNAPSAAPGNLLIAAGLSNQQKPGSVLIFNLFTSSSNSTRSDSQISLTNTNPVNPANVHLFFIDGSNCTVADQIITLTQNQTVSFLASDVDPEVTGYIIAVTVDDSGCPMVANYLVGGSVVRFESGHHGSLPAIGVSGLALSASPCTAGSATASLVFNGIGYDELPRSLAVHTLPSLANGDSPLLIVNRISGNLTSGADKIGALAGLLYDDSEVARSFTISGGMCQLRGMVGNTLPRTVPRYTAVIPAGRTGWMKFWTVDDQAITGVMINEAPSGLSGGHNLQTLTTTSAATLTIPVIPN